LVPGQAPFSDNDKSVLPASDNPPEVSLGYDIINQLYPFGPQRFQYMDHRISARSVLFRNSHIDMLVWKLIHKFFRLARFADIHIDYNNIFVFSALFDDFHHQKHPWIKRRWRGKASTLMKAC